VNADLIQIVIPMLVFTLLIMLLAASVLAVKRRLAPEVDVTVTINDQRAFEARTGHKLLWQLAAQGILLPAACGGRGACGQCRVKVVSGGGPVLPMETGHLTLAELGRGMRLACMIVVRDPLAVSLPQDILEVQRWRATVAQTRHLSTFLKEITLSLSQPVSFVAGNYMLVEAPVASISLADLAMDPESRSRWSKLGLLDQVAEIPQPTTRAYSLANTPAENDIVRFIVRIATPPAHAPPGTPPGQVSSYLFSLRRGDEVNLVGPFGDFRVNESEAEMVFIGGGAGIAPMHAMIVDQLVNRGSQRVMSFWYGARNVRELVYRDRFQELAERHPNFTYQAALSEPEADDDWNGPVGLVHKVIQDRYLAAHPHPEAGEYYLCGPPLMTSAVLTMLDDLGVERQSIYLDDFGS
jgi:Na+-transporting NADH:ubiquinone oxidoreductase subunit F